MLRIAICEDTSAEAERLLELLERYYHSHPHLPLQTSLFSGGGALLEALDAERAFDLYLLDILMPDLDGIELARTLRRRGEQAPVLYLTTSLEHAIPAFSVRALDYLVKPVEEAALFRALDDAVSALGGRVDTSTVVRTAEGDCRVSLGDISYVEVTGHVLHYHLAGGRVLSSRAVRVSFDRAVEDLSADPRFLRPHQSYLVNVRHVVRLLPREFTLDGGQRVPISRLRYAEVRDAYLDHLARAGSCLRGGAYGSH